MHEAVIRWCEHGETVRGLESTRGCSGCVAGICGAALACMLPEEEPARPALPPIFASARERLFAAIGAALGLSAAGALAHHFNLI